MTEPWELRSDDSRTADTLTTFIIFCEDSVVEPSYLRKFQSEIPILKINTIDNQKSGHTNLSNTIKYCLNEGLFIFNTGQYCIKQGVTENIWCVYDRDLESEDSSAIKPEHDIAFDLAIDAALKANLKVAWSNDAFELWILLHFEEVDPKIPLHRYRIYERLTNLFCELPNKSTDLESLTTNSHFSYKETMKKRDNFIIHVLPLLTPRREQAIRRTQSLEGNFHLNNPFHKRNPCTMVHHLVLDILNLGHQKDIIP